jgi:hypothetical protein
VSATITPTATFASVLVLFQWQIRCSTLPITAFVSIFRNGNNLGHSSYGFYSVVVSTASLTLDQQAVTIAFIDIPVTGSAYTYSAMLKVTQGTVTLDAAGQSGMMTLI